MSKNTSWFLKWIAAPTGIIASVILLTGALDLRYVTQSQHQALSERVDNHAAQLKQDSIQNQLMLCYLRALYAGAPEPPCGIEGAR